MHRLLYRLLASVLILATSSFAEPALKPDRPRSTEQMRRDARTLVELLEHYHYNRGSRQPSDYAEVIKDFMGDLDGQRLFFLNADRVEFQKRYGNVLYHNLRQLGSIDSAFEMFEVYEQRVKDRVAWILTELDKDWDFTVNDLYGIDRSKAEWPEGAAASDELWRRRLKFDLLNEMLGKKDFAKAKVEVRQRYERMLKNVTEMDALDISEIFLSSCAQLYDPHSSYLSAESLEDFNIQMKLQLCGIGAVLGIEEDVCVIKEIVPGGPADLDKRLKPNDRILSVIQENGDTIDTVGMKLRKIVKKIRGDKGSTVKFIVQPGNAADSSERREVSIVRDIVKLDSSRAYAGVFTLPGADGKPGLPLGVITVPNFYGGEEDAGGEGTSVTSDVAELVRRLKAAGVQGIVLDLRRNGGGFLSEAIRMTGLFIDNGPVVQVRSFDGSIQVDRDEDRGIVYEGPMAVLVDKFSASASEIVAGALQNYGRAIVVGDSSSHGKGTVQNMVPFSRFQLFGMKVGSPTGAAKITIQKFYLPSGASTQMKGVVPDIVLPSIEDYIQGITEAELPRAMVWDEVPTSFFDGKPLPASLIKPLLDASKERQATLEEFAYLRTNVDWFKARQEQKLVSLNLAERKAQKAADEAFRKEMKARRQALEKSSSYSLQEIRLAPPPPPRIKPAKKAGEEAEEDDDEDFSQGYAKLDVQLREAFRVVADAIALSKDGTRWTRSYQPLTAQAVREGHGP